MQELLEALGKQVGRDWVFHKVVMPPQFPYGVHHSKFFLAQFEAGLRVIISSGNLDLYVSAPHSF
jgi:hypothetical protein